MKIYSKSCQGEHGRLGKKLRRITEHPEASSSAALDKADADGHIQRELTDVGESYLLSVVCLLPYYYYVLCCCCF